MEGITMEKVMTVKELVEMQRKVRDFYQRNPIRKKKEILSLATEATTALNILLEYEEYELPENIATFASAVSRQCHDLADMIDRIEIPVDPRDE